MAITRHAQRQSAPFFHRGLSSHDAWLLTLARRHPAAPPVSERHQQGSAGTPRVHEDERKGKKKTGKNKRLLMSTPSSYDVHASLSYRSSFKRHSRASSKCAGERRVRQTQPAAFWRFALERLAVESRGTSVSHGRGLKDTTKARRASSDLTKTHLLAFRRVCETGCATSIARGRRAGGVCDSISLTFFFAQNRACAMSMRTTSPKGGGEALAGLFKVGAGERGTGLC